MKKLSLALALLGLSSTATYAGGIDYQEPEESGAFTVGVEALYVQPNGNNFLYGYKTAGDRLLTVDPDHQFGYHMDIGYAMPGDGPDISLGYTRFDADDSESSTGVSSLFSGISLTNATSRAKTNYDYTDVDLLLGKEFVLQNRYHFHPFAGVRYANIDVKNSAVYSTTASPVTTNTAEVRSDFDGFGPRVGLDAALELADGFKFVARAAGSMIIGSYDWKYNVAGGTTAAPANTNIRNSDENIVVPEADYRLGVNYTHEFSPETSVGVELGWTTVQYFGVLDNKATDPKNDSSSSLSDWGFQGPYLRVQANIA